VAGEGKRELSLVFSPLKPLQAFQDKMPRRARVVRRPLVADPRFKNKVVGRFISKVMMRGKKGLAEALVYDAFDIIEKQTQKSPVETFDLAIKNASPLLEVKPRRVGGATYQVPQEIKGDRRIAMAMRWIINAARARTGKPMADNLAAELMDAAHNVGGTIKKREEMHKMAEANKAFAHYRW
jgi:small subunit ribosomal protein S7